MKDIEGLTKEEQQVLYAKDKGQERDMDTVPLVKSKLNSESTNEA